MKRSLLGACQARTGSVASSILSALAAVLLASPASAFTPGKDGALTVAAANTVVNQYAPLSANLAVGQTSLTVTNLAANLPGLSAGDLLMIYQAQGATITGTNDFTYGSISALNNAGRYEFVSVVSVDGPNNRIVFEGCSSFGAQYAYTAAGGAQVIRVPQYSSLNVASGTSLVPTAWNGATGGVLAVHVAGTATVSGSLNASERGFRGGQAVNADAPTDIVGYVDTDPDNGAEKGESIAGPPSSYPGGSNQRGAAANGGGGGNSHNNAGGGGANGNNGNPWTVSSGTTGGQGVMPASGNEGFGGTPPYNWTAAWALDPGYVANGNALTNCSGGGRGGYAWGEQNRDELTEGPGDTDWEGDDRREAGGLGGRPLSNDPAGRIFMGGGGGAGHMNNRVAEPTTHGDGGNGGGIVVLIANAVEGSGTIVTNGGIGGQTQETNPNDAPGGGGAGGTVIVRAGTLASSLTINANGGRGGIQPYTRTADESEGGGGGGGGGYIAVSGGAPTRNALGGLYGYSTSQSVDNFQPNGGTSGATGQANASITSIPFCRTWAVGRVFNDVDGDGTLDAGELGIPNVTVTVTTIERNRVLTTDANGFYYVELNPGAVTATVDGSDPDLGPSPVLTTANAVQNALVTSTGLQFAPVGYDTGIVPNSRVTGTVYNDINGNGSQGGGESAYSSVPVVLLWAGSDGAFGTADDVPMGVSLTNGSGVYDFPDVPAGNYRITVVTSSLPANSAVTNGGVNPRTISVAASATATQNFGFATSLLAISISSSAPTPVAPGATYTYTVTVTNPTNTTATNVAISAPLPGEVNYVAASTQVTRPLNSVSTYADDMESNGYGGSTGTIAWDPDWTELSDDGATNNGDVRSVGDGGGGNQSLRIEQDGNGIARSADLGLSDIVAATLSFRYRKSTSGGGSSSWESDDTAILEIADSPTGTFRTIATFTGSTPTTYTNHSETLGGDILASDLTSTTTIRFQVTEGEDNEFFYVDDVVWTITRRLDQTNAGAAPAGLTSNLAAFDLRPGEQAIVTYNVTVRSLVQLAGATTITNTATASASNTGSVSAAVTNYIANGTVTGHVFRDDDGNGVQNGGEPDLPNIDVVIQTVGGPVTVSTDANGNYSASVTPGTVTVNVSESDPQMPTGAVLTTGNDPQVLVVAPGGTTNATPVGYITRAFFAARVFLDLNQDGVQQPGEPFARDISVFVTLSNSQVLHLETDLAGIVRAVLPAGATVVDVNEADGTLPEGGAVVTTNNDPQNGTATIGSVLVASPFGLFWDGPLFVALDYFRANVDAGTGIVTLEWKTSLEESNAGFHIWRADGLASPYRVTGQIIPGLGDSFEGAEYSWPDSDDLAPGEVRSYWLVDQEFDGTATWHGPVSVEGSFPLSSVDDWSKY